MKDYGTHEVEDFVDANYARKVLSERLDWKWENGGIWTTASEVVKHIGLPLTAGAVIAVSFALQSFVGVKRKRTGKNRLVYVPRPRPVAQIETDEVESDHE